MTSVQNIPGLPAQGMLHNLSPSLQAQMFAGMIHFGQQTLVLQGASTQQTGVLNYPLGSSIDVSVPMQPIQAKDKTIRQMTVPVVTL